MKKGLLVVMMMLAAVAAKAEFVYTAGADLTSAYLWRGQFNGGLSFQPELGVGIETDNFAFNFGVWGNIGASDWKFAKNKDTYVDEDGEEIDPNTKFMPELDLMLSVSLFGASVGFNHYYYCDGSNFLSWQSDSRIVIDGNTSTTEIWAGYNFGDRLNVGAYINWYTTIAGNDFVWETDEKFKRAWSTYIELGYGYEFERIGLSLDANLGISPWKSDLYGNSRFAVVNLSARVDKAFDLGICSLNIFLQGSLNPHGLNKENLYIAGSGDEKLYKQKGNGAIGIGVWF